MAVTAHPLATQAAYQILKTGGNAADAAVTAQLVLNLVEPQSSGIGGGAFMLYWDAKNMTLFSFDGRETAPDAADADYFKDSAGRTNRMAGGKTWSKGRWCARHPVFAALRPPALW